jgi:predicted ATP-grasp superfamily ATP-dependent carboligase
LPVRVLSLARDLGLPRTTASLGRAALALEWSHVACAGGLENRPALLRLFAGRGGLLGGPPRAVAAVRDPATLFPFLAAAGIAHAPIAFETPPPGGGVRWLLKRRRSAGGGGVRAASHGERRRPGEHFQQWIDGRAGSAAFVAARDGAAILGVTEALGADDVAGAPAFRYAGSLLGPPGALLGADAMGDLDRAASLLTRRFGLLGLNGFDFIVDRGVPRIIEVNPRWTASMELYESRSGRNLFDLHLTAIDGGTAPDDRPGAVGPPRFLAKAILYAIEPVTAPDAALLEAIGARDRPRAGERFLPGQPICTLLADGADREACLRSLRGRCGAARRLLLQARRALPPAGAAAGRA